MVDWAAVAAFITPLIAAIVGVAGWFAWLDRKRKAFLQDAIQNALSVLEQRLQVVEKSLDEQRRHLDKQDAILSQGLQSIARIEGRLYGKGSAMNTGVDD